MKSLPRLGTFQSCSISRHIRHYYWFHIRKWLIVCSAYFYFQRPESFLSFYKKPLNIKTEGLDHGILFEILTSLVQKMLGIIAIIKDDILLWKFKLNDNFYYRNSKFFQRYFIEKVQILYALEKNLTKKLQVTLSKYKRQNYGCSSLDCEFWKVKNSYSHDILVHDKLMIFQKFVAAADYSEICDSLNRYSKAKKVHKMSENCKSHGDFDFEVRNDETHWDID